MVLNRITGQSQVASADITQRYAVKHGDKRYLNEFVQFCQTYHLYGDRFPLSDTVIEPRFIPPLPLVTSPEEEVDPDVFRVVPQDKQYPFLHAPYNLPTLGIGDLSKGTRRIAILGPVGSGRTTALMTIALWSLNLIDFAPPYDKIQEEIDRYEEKLTPEERAKRIKHRIRVAQQAQERMTEADGRTYIGADEENEVEVPEPFRQSIPIYCNLASLNFQPARRNAPVDPAERLIEALQDQYSFITAKTLPRSLYQSIVQGHALLLFDGYETLNHEEQLVAQDWLEALMVTYPDNYLIITGLPTGYHWLNQVDITPIFLRPWNVPSIVDAIDKQLSAHKSETDEDLRADLILESRFLHPAELALFIDFANSNPENSLMPSSEWPRFYLDQRINDLETWIPFLQKLAEQELDTGSILVNKIVEQERINRTWTPFDITEDDDVTKTNGSTGQARERTPSRRVQRIFTYLRSQGILIRLAPGKYQFKHNLISSYLGGLGLHYAEDAELVEKALNPNWLHAVGYAAETVPIDAAIQARLQQPADVLLTNIVDMSRWLVHSGKKASWRQHLLRLLGNLFVAPNQFLRVREHIVAALVSSRDEGAKMILRAALQNPNPDIRILSSLGLGALHDIGAIQPLKKLLTNPDEMVQIAATLALGAIGTEDALVAVLGVMQQSQSRGVRKAAAEMLAMYPDVGYETLYDAINEETDILLRRAILFGLGRIRTNWALITINEVVSSAKEEYYVRLAAMEVFRMIYEKESQGVNGYPSANAVPWLLAWGQQQQRAGAIDDEATGEDMLLFALESRQPQIRYLALLTISQLGLVKQVPHVYKRLHDPNEAVRDTAYRTLTEFQERMGTQLPLPI